MNSVVKKILRVLPDEAYISLKYFYHFKKLPNLKNPKTFNEKLQWLKLHDRKPEYTKMVDKYEAKKYVAERIGEEYIVPNYGVWDKPECIDVTALPEQFVLKTTHDCGGVVVCRDKKNFNIKKYEEFLNAHLKQNYFHEACEWPYKNVSPRILAEEYVSDEEYEILIPYKVFCFAGEPYMIQVVQDDKQKNESIDYFDTEWNLLALRQNYPNSKKHIEKPEKLEKMLELSKILAAGMDFLRVDWYVTKEKILFSEFTFYSDAGLAAFEPEEWDMRLGEKMSNVPR